MIDERADIHPSAKIAENVEIGPWTIIGEDVEIGEGSWIGPHVVLRGPTKIGKNNKIYPFSSIGDDPQDQKYNGERTTLEIGDNNTIREYVTINRGTVQGGGVTRLGDHNLVMAYVHIAHDCIIGNHTRMASYAGLAGHVTVEDYVIVSSYAAAHQFCTLGESSFVGKASYVNKDVLPFLMIDGRSPKVFGLNSEGLRRRGFSDEKIAQLKNAYKIVFRKNLLAKEALIELHEYVPECPEIKQMMDLLEHSERGIVR